MPEQEPKSFLEFRPSPIHGFGTFAAAPIRAGLLLIEYIGEKITKTEAVRRCEAATRSFLNWTTNGTSMAAWVGTRPASSITVAPRTATPGISRGRSGLSPGARLRPEKN